MKTLLEIEGVSKSFGSVIANENISLTVKEGEILALLGENGAGKSTLVKAVFGLVKPDTGTIKINGTVMESGDTAAAIASGVGMVHQHFQLVPVMSVTENLILGDEPKRFGVVNIKRAKKEALALSEKYGLEVDPDAIIEDLPVGMAQRVEILKALRRDVKLLILDEPTVGLSLSETKKTLDFIQNIKKSGRSAIFIDHNIFHIYPAVDRMIVLDRGKVAGNYKKSDITMDELIESMYRVARTGSIKE